MIEIYHAIFYPLMSINTYLLYYLFNIYIDNSNLHVIKFLLDKFFSFAYHTNSNQLTYFENNTNRRFTFNHRYVVEPYSRYPNLLETLLNFLKTEQSKTIRREVSKLNVQPGNSCFQLFICLYLTRL